MEGITSVADTSCPISMLSQVTYAVSPSVSNSSPEKTQSKAPSETELRGRSSGLCPSSQHTLVKGAENLHVCAGMYRLNPDCWVWSPRPPLCLHAQHSGSHATAELSHQEEEEEEEEEEAGELLSVCCYTSGCEDVISQAADVQWSTCEPPVRSGIPSSSGLTRHVSGARSSRQPTTADGGDVSLHFIGGRCWRGSGMETRGCVCAYGQREPECLGPCWPGSPLIYYRVRRNMVVGVEVVEEVAVEDTLEVITEDLYTDDLLDPQVLQDDQSYPT